jgi:beta-glucuronidase
MAETRGTILHDFDDLKNLQTTLTRPVHYPQNPLVYDYCDEKGILVIPEIPMWQFDEPQLVNPKVVALAKQMLHEMIEQNYNHPSIFAWSLENESATDTPGGIKFIRTLYEEAKRRNPGRLVSFADDRIAFVKDPNTNASQFVDFIMWNEYFGSWDGPESLLIPALERIGKDYSDKMVIISEFGTPGLFAADEESGDALRVSTIKEQLHLFAKYDWIGGAILWCYQDYHSYRNHRPGQADMYVDHGVVDQNRQRRPSYFVWRSENAPAHLNAEWLFDAAGVPMGFELKVERRLESELPSYPLAGYSIEWTLLNQKNEVVDQGKKVLHPLGVSQTITERWEQPGAKTLRLRVHLHRPTGFIAMDKTLEWLEPVTGAFRK